MSFTKGPTNGSVSAAYSGAYGLATQPIHREQTNTRSHGHLGQRSINRYEHVWQQVSRQILLSLGGVIRHRQVALAI